MFPTSGNSDSNSNSDFMRFPNDPVYVAAMQEGPFQVLRDAIDERGIHAVEARLLNQGFDWELADSIASAVVKDLGATVPIPDLPKRIAALADYDEWRMRQPRSLRTELPKGDTLLASSMLYYDARERAAATEILRASKNPAFTNVVEQKELDTTIMRREREQSRVVPMTTQLRSRNMSQFAANRDAARQWTTQHTWLRNELHSGSPSREALQAREAMIRYFLAAGLRAPKRPRGFHGVQLFRGTDSANPMLKALRTRGRYHEKSFTSFSWQEDRARAFGDTVVRMKVTDIERGTPYVWFGVGDVMSHVRGEREVLMPPGIFKLLSEHEDTFDVSFEPALAIV